MQINDVAGDGNCLLWAVMLSYLEEVKNNEEQFKARYKALFSQEVGWERIFKFSYKDFDFFDVENINLVQIFRNVICDYIEKNLNEKRPENKADFKTLLLFNREGDEEKQPEIILEEMRKNGNYASLAELTAICNILKCKITIKSNETQTDYIDPIKPDDRNAIDSKIELHYFYENQHYKYFSNITNNNEENISLNQVLKLDFLLQARISLENKLANKNIDEKTQNDIINVFIDKLTKTPDHKLNDKLKKYEDELSSQKLSKSTTKPLETNNVNTNNYNFLANDKTLKLIFEQVLSNNKNINKESYGSIINIFIKEIKKEPVNKRIEILKTSIFEINNQDKIFDLFDKKRINKSTSFQKLKETSDAIIDIFIEDLTKAPEDKQIEILKTSFFELNNQNKILANPNITFEDLVKPIISQPKTCTQEALKDNLKSLPILC